jgi:hypothetical protein
MNARAHRATIEELRAKITEAGPWFDVPADANPVRCRGCEAMVYFVVRASGKAMPVDVLVVGGKVPHPAERDLTDSGSGRMFAPVVGCGVAHWGACPAAADFRGRR